MADTKRIEEALAHIRAAEKCLKTGLLKWQPDHESASDEYQLAATCYRNAGQHAECRDSLMKAAECHLQRRSLFHAAKCFEQAILMMREQGDLEAIEALAHRACKLYQQQGSPEAGASALEKAAKIVEPKLPEHALNLYRHAVEVTQLEDHARQAGEYASKVSRILVRLRRYDEAVDALLREMAIGVETGSAGVVGRLTVALVLVQLAREDSVAAWKVFREWAGYVDANEQVTVQTLLDAYEQEDADEAQRALRSPFIMHMDVEYARLARELKLPEGMSAPAAAATVATGVAAAAASTAAGSSSMFDEEDDDEMPPTSSAAAAATEEVQDKLQKSSLFDEEDDEEIGAAAVVASVPSAADEEDDEDGGLC